jgi:hypothetical protein
MIKLERPSQLIGQPGQFDHVTASAVCKQPEKHGITWITFIWCLYREVSSRCCEGRAFISVPSKCRCHHYHLEGEELCHFLEDSPTTASLPTGYRGVEGLLCHS